MVAVGIHLVTVIGLDGFFDVFNVQITGAADSIPNQQIEQKTTAGRCCYKTVLTE
jgi:hypothetical protein